MQMYVAQTTRSGPFLPGTGAESSQLEKLINQIREMEQSIAEYISKIIDTAVAMDEADCGVEASAIL